MIFYLRFKRVRRLLQRYVVPGLCASAIALGGCAIPATTAPPNPATDPATKAPMTTVSMEPSIQVGDVTAVYVTVTNLRPDLVPGSYLNEAIVLQAHAVAQSGGQVDRLDVDHAIEKAGAADKLLAAMGERSFEVVTFPPPPEPSVAADVAAGVILAPLFILSAWPDCVVGEISYAFAENKQRIKNKEFPVGRYSWTDSPPVCHIQRGGGEKDQKIFLGPQLSWKGYVFFPRGNYSTLEITAGAINSVAPETRCYWWGCFSPSAFDTVVEQIDRGESPTLRHTETIRCPWRQG